MRSFIYKLDYRKIILISLICVFLFSLSGCATNQDLVLNGFGDESINPINKFLVWPIAWVMYNIGQFFNGSFGIALIITTVLVRCVAWPIYAGANNSMFKMQLAQEDLNKIQSKYLGRTDQASKQRQAMETQAVMKKHGVNMLGCLALPLQFPIFTAMYAVIRRISIEGGELSLTNFNFLGFSLQASISTGGIKNQIFNAFLAATVAGTMYFIQKFNQKKPSYAKNIPNNNPKNQQMQDQMKWIMLMSPIMMGVISLQNSGMALYWVVGNCCSLIQSVINRKMQEKKYYSMQGDEYITPKDLKEAKKIKEKEIIEATSTETSKSNK